jgi:hypothetical protein
VSTIERGFAVLAFSTISTFWTFQPVKEVEKPACAGRVEELKKSKD